ncbi:hypothetical protein SATMO3_36820 [Sporomusa aerivorans]
MDRRNFLKTSAILGVALFIPYSISNVAAAQPSSFVGKNKAKQAMITKHRTLGSGKDSMEVSALGFSVMGMNYNRGPHPEKRALIELLRQAQNEGLHYSIQLRFTVHSPTKNLQEEHLLLIGAKSPLQPNLVIA